MNTIKAISIPQPCHESWQQMTPADKGRHCAQCCKTVTDFSVMTNNQIISYMATTSNVCGRFNEQQLGSLNYTLHAQNLPAASGWKKWIMAAGLFTSTLFLNACAQSQPAPVEQTDAGHKPNGMLLGKIKMPDTLKLKTITGRVTDYNNEALPGAVIKLTADSEDVLTNANGDFKIQVPQEATRFTVSFIGFTSQTVNISASNAYLIKLNEPVVMGDITVIKRDSMPKRVLKKIKSIF